MHYLLTSTMAWTMCEGWHLYHRFIRVMAVEETFWKFALFGWGLPLLWVAIGGAVFADDYGSGELCWIAFGSPALYLVIAPAGSAFVVNIFFFRAVMKVIGTAQSEKGTSVWTQVKAVVTFASTLGLFYIFAILLFATGHVVFQYLLALTATSQGIVVFYFHIYCRPDFRGHIGRSWRNLTTGDARGSRRSTSVIRTGRRSSSESQGSKRSSKRGSRNSTRNSLSTKIGRIHTDFRKINVAGGSREGSHRNSDEVMNDAYLEVEPHKDTGHEDPGDFGF